MPYNSETGLYERRDATVIDATPDGDTVAQAIDVKLDQGIDDYVTDLNHHDTNGNHYPTTSVGSDSRFLKQSPAGEVSWANGVVAADAALKDFSNVADGAIASAKLASVSPAKITQDASNRFVTDAEKSTWNGALYDKADVEGVLTGEVSTHTHMVGALVWATGDTPLPGTIAAQGVELSRATYSRLWAYAQASGNLAVSDAAWTEGQYSPGNGSTTFRTPKVDDRFIRGKSATRAVGLVEEDVIKYHDITIRGSGYAGSTAGLSSCAVNNTAATGFTSTTSTDAGVDVIDIPRDGIPYACYMGADETRPKALTMLPCIVY